MVPLLRAWTTIYGHSWQEKWQSTRAEGTVKLAEPEAAVYVRIAADKLSTILYYTDARGSNLRFSS